MGTSELGFGLLGPLQVTIDGAVQPLGTPKQRAVLAALLINRNRPVDVDSLIGAAWGDEPAAAARASVHTYVSNLRRILGQAGVDSREVLAAAPPGYRLRVPDGACDLDRFVAAKNAGIRAAAEGLFDDAATALGAALAQWRGEALSDLSTSPFAEAFATALTEDRVLVQTTYAEAEIGCGRAAGVIGLLERLVGDHPYREPLWIQLMSAYYRDHRQGEALAAYRRLQTVLAEDLGIDPCAEAQELHTKILRREHPGSVQGSALETLVTGSAAAARSAMNAELRDAQGRRFPLRDATRIGRSKDNDLVLPDPRISRHHAAIFDTGGSYVVADLRSGNGVYVQDRRIRPSATLSDGDRVRIGRWEFVFALRS
jgi:DNA-binding SARP family transcriptional activator